MNILLLGATGATGKELVRQALDAGHTLTVLVRNPSKITAHLENMRVVVGDATDKEAVKSAMAKNEVLVSVLGAMNASLITESTKAILAAAAGTSVKRVIMLSSFAVNREQLNSGAKLLTGIIMKNIISDKKSGENLLRSGNLTWTIVYASALTNREVANATNVRILSAHEKIGLGHNIARSEVAAWILNELHNKSHLNSSVTISR